MDTTTHPTPGTSIAQTGWAPSVVSVGARITGRCVTNGTSYTGTVAEVVGPIRTPDCGGYRYRLTDTGQHYALGGPIQPTVYAERWA